MASELRIGFTNKYYTLWSVSSEIKYGSNEKPYGVNHFYYRQNLSMDLEEAIEKAKKFGVNNLEVDQSLYGKSGSWSSKPKQLFSDLPNSKCPLFNFGKYCDESILDCNDLDYLLWYHRETKNIYAEQVLESNGYVWHKEQFMSKEQYSECVKDEERIYGHHLSNGEKVELELTEISRRGWSGKFGYTTMVEYENENGNVFTYVGSSPQEELENGEILKCVATIKHGEIFGEDITKLNRIKTI